MLNRSRNGKVKIYGDEIIFWDFPFVDFRHDCMECKMYYVARIKLCGNELYFLRLLLYTVCLHTLCGGKWLGRKKKERPDQLVLSESLMNCNPVRKQIMKYANRHN